MSRWGKFLCEVTLGDLTFAWNDGAPRSATVTGDTWPSLLEWLADLQTAMNAVAGTWTVAVSELGIVTITAAGAETVNWAGTSDALETLLGFDGTEAFDGNKVLTATNQHTHGWYPGLISFGRDLTRGAGEVLAEDWVPDWPVVDQIAGTGARRRVGCATPAWSRRVGYDLIHSDELNDGDAGLHGFLVKGYTNPVRWYPDRADGTVAAPGTQGNPLTSAKDSSCDYWKVFLGDLPARQTLGQQPSYKTITLLLYAEPT